MISFFNSRKRKKQYKDVSLVLSGGGARGFGHIGVIEVLVENGYHIKNIVGTSMGAVVGGLYAMGEMDNFKNWILNMKNYQALDLVDISFRRRGLLKGERVFRKMKNNFPTQNIEDLKIPFTAIATKLYEKEIKVFNNGDIYDAFRASAAIPTVFTPVEIENDVLVDGGILNNIPIQFANRSKKDLLIVVDVNAFISLQKDKEKPKRLSSYLNVLTQTISVLLELNSKDALLKNPPDILIQLSREHCEIFDFFKAKKQIEYGRKCAEKAISEFLKED